MILKIQLQGKFCKDCFHCMAWIFLWCPSLGIFHLDVICSYHELLLLRGSFPNLPWSSHILVLSTFFPTKSLFFLLWFTQIFYFVRPLVTIVIVEVKVLNVINVFACVRRTVTLLAPSTGSARSAPSPWQVKWRGRWRRRHGGGRHIQDWGSWSTRVWDPVASQRSGPRGVRWGEGCDGGGGVGQGIWILMERMILWLLAAKDVSGHLVVRWGWIAVLTTDPFPGRWVPDQVVVLLLQGAQLPLHLALHQDQQRVRHLPLGLVLPLRPWHGISWW